MNTMTPEKGIKIVSGISLKYRVKKEIAITPAVKRKPVPKG